MINYLKLLIGIILAPILFMIYDGIIFAYCLYPSGKCGNNSFVIKQLLLLCLLTLLAYKYSETSFYILLCLTLFVVIITFSPNIIKKYLEKLLSVLSYPLNLVL